MSSDTVAPGSFAPERVECPDGMVAVGGGVDVENVLTMQVTSSAPVFEGSGARTFQRSDGSHPAPIGWQASVHNEDTSSRSFKVAVVCGKLSGVTTVISSDSAPAGSFGTERPLCPSGREALGGGVDSANVLKMMVTSSAPAFGSAASDRLFQSSDGTLGPPRAWQASVLNEDSDPRTFKVAVICGEANALQTIVSSDTAGSGSFKTKRSLCPSGSVALSGGVDPENVLDMIVTSTAPAFGSASGDRLFLTPGTELEAPSAWQASVINEDTDPKTFKVAAVCLPV